MGKSQLNVMGSKWRGRKHVEWTRADQALLERQMREEFRRKNREWTRADQAALEREMSASKPIRPLAAVRAGIRRIRRRLKPKKKK